MFINHNNTSAGFQARMSLRKSGIPKQRLISWSDLALQRAKCSITMGKPNDRWVEGQPETRPRDPLRLKVDSS